MRSTLKLLLLLGIGLLMAKPKGGDGPEGNGDDIDPITGRPRNSEERDERLNFQGKNASTDMEGVHSTADQATKDGRADKQSNESNSDVPQDSDGDGQPDSDSDGGPYATSGDLEGQTDVQIDNPNDPSDTITDIDRVEDGVLWEEKSATDASNPQRWVDKHIERKFNAYLRAQQYMQGYENAPIGFNFTQSGVDPGFKAAIEARISELQAQNPGVDIRLEWS